MVINPRKPSGLHGVKDRSDTQNKDRSTDPGIVSVLLKLIVDQVHR